MYRALAAFLRSPIAMTSRAPPPAPKARGSDVKDRRSSTAAAAAPTGTAATVVRGRRPSPSYSGPPKADSLRAGQRAFSQAHSRLCSRGVPLQSARPDPLSTPSATSWPSQKSASDKKTTLTAAAAVAELEAAGLGTQMEVDSGDKPAAADATMKKAVATGAACTSWAQADDAAISEHPPGTMAPISRDGVPQAKKPGYSKK